MSRWLTSGDSVFDEQRVALGRENDRLDEPGAIRWTEHTRRVVLHADAAGVVVVRVGDFGVLGRGPQPVTPMEAIYTSGVVYGMVITQLGEQLWAVIAAQTHDSRPEVIGDFEPIGAKLDVGQLSPRPTR